MEITPNVKEMIVLIVFAACLMTLAILKLVSGDDVVKMLMALMGYVFGRILNHRDGTEPPP